MTLLLFRHGKTAHGPDRDRLSSTGEEQIRLLGRALNGLPLPDRLFHGTHRRHHQSADILRGIWTERAFPMHPGLHALDEFDVRVLAASGGGAEVDGHAPGTEKVYAYIREVFGGWVHASDCAYESFGQFLARCRAELDRLGQLDGTIAVVTSGGVIAALAASLDADPRATFLARVAEAGTGSISEIEYDGSTPRVVRFGDLGHLPVELHTIL